MVMEKLIRRFNASPSSKKKLNATAWPTVSTVPSSTFPTASFGVNLEELCLRDGQDIPLVLTQLCLFIINSRGLRVEGIFRVNGNMRVVEILRNSADNKLTSAQSEEFLQDVERHGDIHSAASLIKLFIREIPIGLIPISLSKKLLSMYDLLADEMDCLKIKMKYLLGQLPKAHLLLLKYICSFLKKVVANQIYNKMSSIALGIVFGPNVFRFSQDVRGLVVQNTVNQMMTILIDHVDYFFRTSDLKIVSTFTKHPIDSDTCKNDNPQPKPRRSSNSWIDESNCSLIYQTCDSKLGPQNSDDCNSFGYGTGDIDSLAVSPTESDLPTARSGGDAELSYVLHKSLRNCIEEHAFGLKPKDQTISPNDNSDTIIHTIYSANSQNTEPGKGVSTTMPSFAENVDPFLSEVYSQTIPRPLMSTSIGVNSSTHRVVSTSVQNTSSQISRFDDLKSSSTNSASAAMQASSKITKSTGDLRVAWAYKKASKINENFSRHINETESLSKAKSQADKLNKPQTIIANERTSPDNEAIIMNSSPSAIWPFQKLPKDVLPNNESNKPACIMNMSKTKPFSLQELFTVLETRLERKREFANRPKLIGLLNFNQLEEEKLDLQKALLSFEDTHGRPKEHNERVVMRPLYDRYRIVKRLVAQMSAQKISNVNLTVKDVLPNFLDDLADEFGDLRMPKYPRTALKTKETACVLPHEIVPIQQADVDVETRVFVQTTSETMSLQSEQQLFVNQPNYTTNKYNRVNDSLQPWLKKETNLVVPSINRDQTKFSKSSVNWDWKNSVNLCDYNAFLQVQSSSAPAPKHQSQQLLNSQCFNGATINRVVNGSKIDHCWCVPIAATSSTTFTEFNQKPVKPNVNTYFQTMDVSAGTLQSEGRVRSGDKPCDNNYQSAFEKYNYFATEEVLKHQQPPPPLSHSNKTADQYATEYRSMHLRDLQVELRKVHTMKRILQKNLKDFEHEFEKNNGRKVEIEDRVPMYTEYNRYKLLKSRLSSLEQCIISNSP